MEEFRFALKRYFLISLAYFFIGVTFGLLMKEAGYDGVKVIVQDKNAWDYTIKARVLGALERGSKA